ncbi:MAG: DinB-like domain protein [Gemmatimonadetes bacterium]|nr:DinB-like domain protein [Gemmatimonadota bacterium]
MKTTRILLLAIALPLGVAAAQAPITNPVATAFRNRTTALRRNIAQAFDSIPESKFGYKPTPAQLSFGYIAQHVASDNYFFCNNFGDKKATLSSEETTTPDSIKAKWPKDKLVANLKASIAFCDDAMGQLDDAKVAEVITVPGPNGTTRQAGRATYVLGHAIDLADHYSQLANYMRLNGMVPPSALPRPGRGGN